jgi:two-component system NarL family sensor kinase
VRPVTSAMKPERERTFRWVVVGPVLQFTLMGLFAVAVVGVATAVASRRVGEREAITDARTTTLIRAQTAVEPVVLDTLAGRDPAALARVNDVVVGQVLDRSLVRVKIWSRDGEIVYSDEPRLIGNVYRLGEEEVAALDRGEIVADVSDLSTPENQYERPWKKLLEVYLPIRTPGGGRLLFEAYFRYDAVAAAGSRVWRSFAPISLTALAVLELLQIPLAWSLARRLRQRQREREGLLREALDASGRERRRIASDIHDGVVQDLAGVAYALAGAARQRDTPEPVARVFGESSAAVSKSLAGLRSLLVEIYPPNLAEEGLVPAVTDLLSMAARRGIATSLDDAGLPEELPGTAAALLYRVVQEAVRNVVSHSRATSLSVRLWQGASTASVEVVDDGVGFDTALAEGRAAEGHLGLRGLKGLVGDAGGRLDVASAPGAGTTVRAEVPRR